MIRRAFSIGRVPLSGLTRRFTASLNSQEGAENFPFRDMSDQLDRRLPTSTFRADGMSATEDTHKMFVSMLEHNIKQCLMAYPYYHPAVANSYMELGVVVQQDGYTEKALRYFQHALKIYSHLSEEKPTAQTAAACAAIGSVYFDRRDLPQSLEFHERAMREREEVLPPRHPLLAESANNCATLYTMQNKHYEAAEMFAMALGIIRENSKEGQDGPLVALTLYNLGCALRAGGWWERAKICLEEGRDIAEDCLGFHDAITVRISDTLKAGPPKKRLMTAGELIEARKRTEDLLRSKDEATRIRIETEERLMLEETSKHSSSHPN